MADTYSAMADDTLSITDNRTGKTYEVPITDDTIKAMDLRQIKVDEDDFGMMAYDPAFTNTASCRSEITYIDGAAGVLEYRGYTIEDLCEKRSYLEVAYLLIHGELPTRVELDAWVHDITIHTFVHENVKSFMQGFRYDAHPMGMLLAAHRRAVDLLSRGDQHQGRGDPQPPGHPPAGQGPDAGRVRLPPQHGAAVRVSGQRPVSYAGNFLSMMYKMTELKYEPDPRLEKALDVLFILHADHEQNASTSPCASSVRRRSTRTRP